MMTRSIRDSRHLRRHETRDTSSKLGIAAVALFSFARSKPERAAILPPPIDPRWARSAKGRFYRLVQLDSDQVTFPNGPAVFVIWHGGVKPGWVYVGRTSNLSAELKERSADSDILFYHKHGGLSVSWASVKPEFQGGVVRYLIDVMKPLVDNPAEVRNDSDPVPVIRPGA